jgi:predicted TIM-barrel fold metal-dependent hydrolase
MTDLERLIVTTPLIDTHEHLRKEAEYVENGPDVLTDIFDNYLISDLAVAGATWEALNRLRDSKDPDLAGRFAGIRTAWEACGHTGYGEAVRWIARNVYGMDEITPGSLEAAQEANRRLRQPGERLRLLKEVANLDHVQVDDFQWACLPDASGPDFFFYDLSWAGFASGDVKPEEIHQETGIGVKDLVTLRAAMEAIFAKYAPCAIAVKTQHAYRRTLLWRERDEADVARVLEKRLRGDDLTTDEALCLGDWGIARGVELAAQHNLPVKIHTGYYAGSGNMPVERIRAGHLTALLTRYPQTRFVLMHIAYPYSNEMVALAKHYPNVYVDMCWAWSIDPYSAGDFVRRMIHAAPAHKLFAFGGDTFWPNSAVAYAFQARKWLTRALSQEVADGLLTEKEAMALATRWMRTNQEACFDIAGTRARIAERLR